MNHFNIKMDEKGLPVVSVDGVTINHVISLSYKHEHDSFPTVTIKCIADADIDATGEIKKQCLSAYSKCGQCKHLDLEEKTCIGFACNHPEKTWRHDVSKYHSKSCRACKLFEERGE